MRKIYIRTSDIFDYKDAEKRMKHFDFCRKKVQLIETTASGSICITLKSNKEKEK
ncbi:hypothetical protein [Blautia massiliensis (ex Durand et al. 2017)]|uniref:hypothetical protein n=1 Tax=Blautia massiliensis (ex Durand et al. 2017) TaxID=1737424 RepID=UPI00156D4B68|nr:hypothetical protein [Blautia massiliensis (ex Durand et al. 2017)]